MIEANGHTRQLRIADAGAIAAEIPATEAAGRTAADPARIISLLIDDNASDTFFRHLRKALPRAAATRIKLVRPDQSAREDAVGWLPALSASAAIAVEHADPRTPAYLSARGDARCYVWCIDAEQVDGYDGQVGVVGIHGATVVDFAWDFNRFVAGDLCGPIERTRPAPTVSNSPHPSGGDLAPSKAQEPAIGLEVSIPPPPGPDTPVPAEPPPPPLAALSSLLPRERSAATSGPAPRSQPETTPDHLHPGPGGAPARRTRGGRTPHRLARWLASHRRAAHRPTPELALAGRRLVDRGSTVILVGGRKGGSGKTMTVASLAMSAARAVEPFGGTVICVDQNITNPDLGGELGMPRDAPTVRNVVEALGAGRVPPEAFTVPGTRLSALPDPRIADGYGKAEVDRLAGLLRSRYTVVVVDSANTMPSVIAGAAGAVLYYWVRHADIIVSPVRLDRSSWLGMAETLDDIEEVVAASQARIQLPAMVVPILVSPGGDGAFEIPNVAAVRNDLAESGVRFVEVPEFFEIQTRSWHGAGHLNNEVSREEARAAERLFLTVEDEVAKRDDTTS